MPRIISPISGRKTRKQVITIQLDKCFLRGSGIEVDKRIRKRTFNAAINHYEN